MMRGNGTAHSEAIIELLLSWYQQGPYTYLLTSGPIDRSPGIPGSDTNVFNGKLFLLNRVLLESISPENILHQNLNTISIFSSFCLFCHF